MLRMFGDYEPGERVDCGKPGVARGDAISTLGLKGLQEPADAISAHIRDVQGFDWALGLARGEVQQQHQGVAVTADRVQTHPAQRRKVLLKEAYEASAKFGRLTWLHGRVSWTRSPNRLSKRSLARPATSGTNGR